MINPNTSVCHVDILTVMRGSRFRNASLELVELVLAVIGHHRQYCTTVVQSAIGLAALLPSALTRQSRARYSPGSRRSPITNKLDYLFRNTARVLARQAEAIVRTGKTWPQATKRRKVTKRRN